LAARIDIEVHAGEPDPVHQSIALSRDGVIAELYRRGGFNALLPRRRDQGSTRSIPCASVSSQVLSREHHAMPANSCYAN
jgi:hypothetical protein